MEDAGESLVLDIDLDEDPDVLLIPRSAAAQLYRNTGGHLDPPLTLNIRGTSRAAVGDLDLDGDPDLVLLGGTPPGGSRSHPCTDLIALNQWAEQGYLGFRLLEYPLGPQPQVTCPSPAPLPSCSPGVPLLLDWDRDGDLDLGIAGDEVSGWRFWRNDFGGFGRHLTEVTSSLLGGAALRPATDAKVGDVNGDGLPDIFAVGPAGAVVLVNRRQGASFVDEAIGRGVLAGPLSMLGVADFELDGDSDLIVAGKGAMRFYVNNGGILSDVTPDVDLPLPAQPFAVVETDFDFDGHPDLLVTSEGDHEEPALFLYSELAGGVPVFQVAPVPPELSAPARSARPHSYQDRRRLLLGVALPTDGLGVGAMLASAPDSDCDGMPDGFEQKHGLAKTDSTNAGDDADADEVSNRLEYLFGLNPTLAGSHQDGELDRPWLARQMDNDGDGVHADLDRCPNIADPVQADLDGDGKGDACDSDPTGAGTIPALIEVREFAEAEGLRDHRYLSADASALQEASRLIGYYPQPSAFRWFGTGAPGLLPVRELTTPAGVHQYVFAFEVPPPGEITDLGFVSASPSFSVHADLVPLRRFQDPASGHQILTIDAARAATLLARGYEELLPMGYAARASGRSPRALVIAELEDAATQRRTYTSDAAREPAARGFVATGANFRVSGRAMDQLVPLYRLTHPLSRDQILTASGVKRDELLAVGYRAEGILGYLFPRPSQFYPGELMALQHLRGPGGADTHVFTADRLRFEALLAAGWRPEGVVGFALGGTPKRADAVSYACMPASGTVGPPSIAERFVTGLRELPDEQRGPTAALLFTALCAARRALQGEGDTPIESQIRARVDALDPDSSAQAAVLAGQLESISAADRRELLGDLVALDPGDCTETPPLLASISESLRAARLRANFCADVRRPYDSADPSRQCGPTRPELCDNASRAVTVNAKPFKGRPTCPTKCPQVIRGLAYSAAAPVLQGLQSPTGDPLGEGASVSGALELENDFRERRQPRGEGFFPYGILTAVSCDGDSPPASGRHCSEVDGTICGGKLNRLNLGDYRHDRCYAFPVVKRGAGLTARGYNFWDQEGFQAQIKPIEGDAVLNPKLREALVTNDPDEAEVACKAPPDPDRQDIAHFRFDVSQGFYKLRVYNRNGYFQTHNDPIDAASRQEGRTIHVCYRIGDEAVPPAAAVARHCVHPGGFPAVPELLCQTAAQCDKGDQCEDRRRRCELVPAKLCRTNVDCGPGEGSCVGEEVAGTNLECTPTVKTCGQDGIIHNGQCPTTVWPARSPRALSQCLYQLYPGLNTTDPDAPPICGETPEFFPSPPIVVGKCLLDSNQECTDHRDCGCAVADDDVACDPNLCDFTGQLKRSPIIRISEDPRFRVTVQLRAAECIDETNIEFGTDDELKLVFTSLKPGETPPPGVDLTAVWTDDNMDQDDYEHPRKLLSDLTPLLNDDAAAYAFSFSEVDDTTLAKYIAAGAIIVGVVAVAVTGCLAANVAAPACIALALNANAGLLGAAGLLATAVVLIIWAQDDESLGAEGFVASPAGVLARINATHSTDFVSRNFDYQENPGAFKPDEGSSRDGKPEQRLLHPLESDQKHGDVLKPNCDSCETDEECFLERCIPAGTLNETLAGFREYRNISRKGSDGEYGIELLWQRKLCVDPPQEIVDPETETRCEPP